jgi:hypothetical protein
VHIECMYLIYIAPCLGAPLRLSDEWFRAAASSASAASGEEYIRTRAGFMQCQGVPEPSLATPHHVPTMQVCNNLRNKPDSRVL